MDSAVGWGAGKINGIVSYGGSKESQSLPGETLLEDGLLFGTRSLPYLRDNSFGERACVI